MSCTSYKEVLDPKQAVKELSGKLSSPTCTIILVSLEIKFGDSPPKKKPSEAGYLCCFDTNEAADTDVIQILNLLTVSELREVMCMLKKVCYYY